ncbi:hypothetical protein KP509_02G011100 [Ceratopteris richardii]|nr:hypothetical protein KP509_02G011100 [Ceratopteris richardii]
MGACVLETRLMALEREHKKINAFKRELPLCMQLLHDAIEACKEQIAFYRSSPQRLRQNSLSRSIDDRASIVVVESDDHHLHTSRKPFNSLCTNANEVEHKRINQISIDSLQRIVWNSRAESSVGEQEGNHFAIPLEEGLPWCIQGQSCWPVRPDIGSNKKQGGAFMPYNRVIQPIPRPGAIDPAVLTSRCSDSGIAGSLNEPDPVGKDSKSYGDEQRYNFSSRETSFQHQATEQVRKEQVGTNTCSANHATRKARRSWSPELHRLFVDALEKLGGAQATPKQIRERMNVEGLTNDEVKSHLQKYRLHARRLGVSSKSSSQSLRLVAAESTSHDRVTGAPISYSSYSSRETGSCELSATQDVICRTNKTPSIPSSCPKQSTMLHPQDLWQGAMDVCREESVGEANRPENSGSKSRELNETDEMEDHSFSGIQTHSDYADEMDHEDLQPKVI